MAPGRQAAAAASALGLVAAVPAPAFLAGGSRRLEGGGFSWALKLHETCKTPIATLEDCQHAARAMGLWQSAPQVDDVSDHNDHDPPFCYMEYDDSRKAGILKFNPRGTNSGLCNKYDRCLCECKVATAGQWVLAQPREACATTCARSGRRCSKAAMQAHNHDVDTQQGISQIVQQLGHQCKTFDESNGANGDVPVLDILQGQCFYSRHLRDEGSFDCEAAPPNADDSKSRLCWCEEDSEDRDMCPSAFAHTAVQGAAATPCPISVGPPRPVAPPHPAAPPPAPVAQPCPVILPKPVPVPHPQPPPPPPPPPPTRAPLPPPPTAPPPQPPTPSPPPELPCSPAASRAAMAAALKALRENEEPQRISEIAAAAAVAAGCPPPRAAEQALIVSHVVFSQTVVHHHVVSEDTNWLPLLVAVSLVLCLCGVCMLLCGKRFRFKIHQHSKARSQHDLDEQQPLVGGGTTRTEFHSHSFTARDHEEAFHVGSGYNAHAEYTASATAHLPAPRFGIGARVVCHVSGEWREGTVMRQWWRDESWASGEFVPYVILLDNGQHCCAPRDDDGCIRLWDDWHARGASSPGGTTHFHHIGSPIGSPRGSGGGSASGAGGFGVAGGAGNGNFVSGAGSPRGVPEERFVLRPRCFGGDA